jgi:hypothetical protein
VKAFLSLVVIFLPFFVSAAVSNPLIRVCHQKQGNFWLLNNNNELPVCILGNTFVGAEALVRHTAGEAQISISMLLSNSKKISDCGTLGAMTLEGVDPEKGAYRICRFQDGSMMDFAALSKGRNHPENRALIQALK